MSFPRYPAYKDSGVEWLGEVPEDWQISRLGWESWVRARLGWKGLKAEEYVEDGFIFLATPNIKERYIDFENVNFINQHRYEESPEIKLQEGDVLLAKDGSTLGTVNIIRALPRPATVNSSIAVITPGAQLSGLYLFYLFQSSFLAQTIQRIKGGMGVPHLFQEDLNRFHLPLPPADQQTAIATFLDRETAKLDALVAEYRTLIELLKEKRRAAISHAVTKGLDPKVPMKDSGVEWLGEVPEHWELGNIRHFASMRTGHTPSRRKPEYWEDCDIPWFTLADVWQLRDGRQKFLGETASEISKLGLANSAAELLPTGTVCFSRTASVGFSGIMPQPMATSQDFWNWIPKPGIRSEYLLYLFRAMRPEFDRLTMGSTHKTIYQADAAGLHICLPPLEEQTAIAAFLDDKTAKLDALVNETEQAISLLQERRTALISAAVTGKIDVRGLVDRDEAA